MTTANSPTLDQALALARRLSARDRARLIAQIAEELAEATPPTDAAGADRRHLGRRSTTEPEGPLRR
jgi:hypothetical protein